MPLESLKCVSKSGTQPDSVWMETIHTVHTWNGAVHCLITVCFVLLKCCCNCSREDNACLNCVYIIYSYVHGILTIGFAVFVQFGFQKDHPNFCNLEFSISPDTLGQMYWGILVMLLLGPCLCDSICS